MIDKKLFLSRFMKLQDGLIFFYQSLHSLLDNLLILSGLRLKESYEFYKNRMMLILCWVTQSLTSNFCFFLFFEEPLQNFLFK